MNARRPVVALVAGGLLSVLLGSPSPVLAGPLRRPGAARTCTSDADKDRWLASCAWAVREDRPSLVLDPTDTRDPWSILESAEKVFVADDHLADRFVDRCLELAAPETEPAKDDQQMLAEFRSLARSLPCDARALKAWLGRCVADGESLAPGGRRSELLELFMAEGGISHPCDRAFLHRRCDMLKVRVIFRCREDDRDVEEEPEDEVETVQPYIGFFFPG